MQKPMQRVKITKAIACYTKIQDQNLSLGYISQVNLTSAAPSLQNLRIGLKRRRNGKSKVPVKQRGGSPKMCLKLKEHQRATFFSPSENRCLPASTLKLEERDFVADPGASMHMISKTDLSDAELEIVRISRSPTTVITDNG